MLERIAGILRSSPGSEGLQPFRDVFLETELSRGRVRNLDVFSLGVGRIIAGGKWNPQDGHMPPIFVNGAADVSQAWFNLMLKNKKLRKRGVRSFGKGIMSVVHEGREQEADGDEMFPFGLISDELLNKIERKIDKRGRDGEQAMEFLKRFIECTQPMLRIPPRERLRTLHQQLIS